METAMIRNVARTTRLALGLCLLVAVGCQAPATTTTPETATVERASGEAGAAVGQAAQPTPTGDNQAALVGAWRLVSSTDPGRQVPNSVKIVAENSYTFADYDLNQKQFIAAGGGTFSVSDGRYTENVEYDTRDSTRVGSSLAHSFDLSGNTLRLTTQQGGRQVEESWERIDAGDSPLAGAWRIRERETQPGQMSVMQRGPRKTIKWLSGTRFQWAAINTETKQFFGTGGGTYTLQDGKYTEHIEFFSRDNSRVGASLTFDYEVKDGDWHHRGKSSTGNPIYEVWALERDWSGQ